MACASGKVGYRSAAAAKRAMRGLSGARGVYRCRTCGAVHLFNTERSAKGKIDGSHDDAFSAAYRRHVRGEGVADDI